MLEHLPKAPGVLASPRHAAVRAGRDYGPGLALEFGVAAGTTLKIIAEGASSDRTVVGFDILTGLPETWRTGFPAGEFAQRRCPIFPVLSWLSGCSRTRCPASPLQNDEQIAFMHLDCDLYSSTKTVLDLAGDRLAP